MSADFEKVLVKDSRLDVSDSIKYAVIKGGQNVTVAPFRRISESTSQIVFNVQVPSEQTIIDRRVLLQAELEVIVSNKTPSYGVAEALASFPLHQLMTVMNVTINNNTVSLNVRDVLPVIVRLLCEDDLVWFNSSTPTFADMLASYGQFGGLNNANSALWGCNDPYRLHRGSYVPFSYDVSVADTQKYKFKLTEPLLISPFIYSNLKANNQGFYGIQNMNIVLNLDSNPRRVWRGPEAAGGALSFVNPSYKPDTITAVSFDIKESTLLFNFLTPHPSDLMPARNIVPFYELPRYITSYQSSIGKSTFQTKLGSGTLTTGEVTLNTLQLNQIPDKLILYARLTGSKQTWGNPDVCLPIEKVAIQFNNNAGILSTAKQVNLWEMSRNNGLTSSWVDWSGLGVSGADSNGTGSGISSTVGSYLVLEFGKDIQLTEDFYAPGSLGNFNLQVNVTVQNNTEYDIAAGDVEVILITMNSGVFVCERGTSSTYTGILTKQDVLEASQQDHYTHDDVERMVGGGFFDKIKSGFSKLKDKAKEHGSKLLEEGKAKAKEHAGRALEKGKEMAKEHAKQALSKYLM